MSTQGASEFRAGWPVLIAAMVGNGLGFVALPFYTIGAMAPHLAQEFGWGFGEIMTCVPIVSVVVLTLSPIIGRITDRIGVRPVVMTSLLLFGFAFMAFALNNGSLTLFYGLWVLLGIAGAGTLPITWTRAVNTWFDANKGIALGITMMGTGIFGSAAKFVIARIVEDGSWRTGFLVMGAAPLVIALPLAYMWFRERPAPVATSRADAVGFSYGEVLRSWRFWLIGFAFMMLSFALGGPMPHLENILFDKGFTRGQAAEIVIVFGLAVVVGRIVGGLLLDRLWAPVVAAILFLLPAAGLWVFIGQDASVVLAYMMLILFGLGTGVEYDLMAFLIARYFGMRTYSASYGTLYLMFGIGAGAGPPLFGWAFDAQGNYAMALAAAIVLLIVPTLMLFSLGPYRFKKESS